MPTITTPAASRPLLSSRVLVSGLRLLVSSAYRIMREDCLGQYLPLKPVVLQFPINDICNSRCIMCNVWQRKRDREFTVDELRRILADPLFTQIRYVGINGGEPTLRPDLAQIGQVLVDTLPKLSGVGIITNAVRPWQVIERITGLADVMRSAGVHFDASVSLDGIGDTHDRQRGVDGNFEAVQEVIHGLRNAGIPMSIGCTLTAVNCHDADDVLLWCKDNQIRNWEFRLGVQVKRLYNEGLDSRLPLTPEQRFHLAMFFDKLAGDASVPELHRRTYAGISEHLAFGARRRFGCDWRARGVTLDARGDISYCSTRSPILGSALQASAWRVYKQNLAQRRHIIKTFCNDCMHLGGETPPDEQLRELVAAAWREAKRVSVVRKSEMAAPARIHPAERSAPNQWRHVLITGWYGTETAGDKAILGELLHFLNSHAPGCRITLTTLNHKVTDQTRRELTGLENAEVVEMQRAHARHLINDVDAVIIGGGPLMEITETEHLYRVFSEANRQRKARVIFGCGIGPLHTEEFQRTVGAICQMATAGYFRDPESRDYAISLGGIPALGQACDPALAWVQRWRQATSPARNAEVPVRIAGLLRANTSEYVRGHDPHALEAANVTRARQVAEILDYFCRHHAASVDLLAMHVLHMGGDDRIFNRMVSSHVTSCQTLRVQREYLTLQGLLESLATVDLALAMRYHSHLFCMALGIPFLSIDYTRKSGKVRNLIHRIGYEQWCEEWESIDVSRASSRLMDLLGERPRWSEHLLRQTDRLVSELHQTYEEVFHVQSHHSGNPGVPPADKCHGDGETLRKG